MSLVCDLVTEITRPARRKGAEALLKSHGWNKLGSGVFGVALSHPSHPYVLKLVPAVAAGTASAQQQRPPSRGVVG